MYVCGSKSAFERGSILIESAVCIPTLIILFVGLVDLCQFARTNMIASRVAYETARFAASSPGLGADDGTASPLLRTAPVGGGQDDVDSGSDGDTESETPVSSSASAVNQQVKKRAESVLEKYGLAETNSFVKLTYEPTVNANQLMVEIEIEYEPILLNFAKLAPNSLLSQARSKVTSPYLYP